MGILDGGIQSLFGTVMGAFYLNATIVRHVVNYDNGGSALPEIDISEWVLANNAWNDDGLWLVGIPWDAAEYSYSLSYPAKVQEDDVSEQTRAAGGFSQNEKVFIILQKNVPIGLNGDDHLLIGGIEYALREPRQDPAKSYWYVRGVPV